MHIGPQGSLSSETSRTHITLVEIVVYDSDSSVISRADSLAEQFRYRLIISTKNGDGLGYIMILTSELLYAYGYDE